MPSWEQTVERGVSVVLCCDPEEERKCGLFKELQLMPFSCFLVCWIITAMLTKPILIALIDYLNSAIWEWTQPRELWVEEQQLISGQAMVWEELTQTHNMCVPILAWGGCQKNISPGLTCPKYSLAKLSIRAQAVVGSNPRMAAAMPKSC